MTAGLLTPQGRRIAFVRNEGLGPEVCFLPGLRSDMQGTKALHLRDWAAARGRAFLRFDYSGHGESSGAFEDGCVGDWTEDAAAVILGTPGRKLLVGSSMGGWVALLLARSHPERVAGLVLLAAAPDFASGLPPWRPWSAAEAEELAKRDRITLPDPFGGQPTILTRRLIDDSARQRVFGRPLPLPMPVRLLHGTDDAEVPVDVAIALLRHAEGGDVALTVMKGADHRLSSPAALARLELALQEVLGAAILSEN